MRNKVRVTKLMGAGADFGLMDPKINMKVRHHNDTRWIVGTGGPLADDTVQLAVASGGAITSTGYPHECYIQDTDANYFGWPSSVGSITFGHHGIFPNGVPNAIGSGMVYEDGGGNEISFSRAKNPS